MLKKLMILAAMLAMLLAASAPLVLAQSEEPVPNEDDVLRCLIPEGCDTNGDGAPDLRAGEPTPVEGPGNVQYDNTADGPPEVARCLERLSDGFCTYYVATDGGIVNATPPA